MLELRNANLLISQEDGQQLRVLGIGAPQVEVKPCLTV